MVAEPWIEVVPLPDADGDAGFSGAVGLARRVAERAAWRAIVRRRLGLADDSAIGYNKNGAPILRGEFGGKGGKGGKGGTGGTGGELGYIGVSHTRGWVAVVWSPAPCAIDIELRTRTLSPAVAARYSIGSMEEWCALEAEYKFTGLTGRRPDPGSVRLLPHPELIVAVIP